MSRYPLRTLSLFSALGLFVGCSPSSNGARLPHFGTARASINPTLSPANVTLAQGQTQQFTAAGTGPYTWALQSSPSGSITSAGFYTAGYAGSAGATDTVTVTDTGAGNTTATATVTISKGVRSLSNGGVGNGVVAGNGFPIQNNLRVGQRAAQTFQALAPASGDTTGMVTLVEFDMVRVSGGSGQLIKAEIHALTAGGGIDDQGASNAYSSGSVNPLVALPNLNQKTRVVIPMTPGTALTVGTNYAVVIKVNVSGTLNAFVSVTPPNDPNGGVAWWYSKRYLAGGWIARGFYTSTPADYTKDTQHNLSGNVFIGEVYSVPTLTSLNPASDHAGDPAFTLTLNGTNFFLASAVRWAGSARTTTYVSTTRLTATIPLADSALTGTAAVTVTNPAPGGGTSGSQTFTINAGCAPGLTSCSGSCVNLQTDPNNCNACAAVCPSKAHAQSICTAGVCGRACTQGYFDLDGGVGAGCDFTCTGEPYACTDGVSTVNIKNHILSESGTVFQGFAAGSSYAPNTMTGATSQNVGVLGESTPPLPVGNVQQSASASKHQVGLNALSPP